MLSKSDKSALFFAVAAVGFFAIGGLLTTVVPPMVDSSWSRPFHNADPAKGPTGELKQYTALELKGRAIYVREGCWYCHTQQVRKLPADVARFGWRGTEAPVSIPAEYADDAPHFLGTRRIGPDLSRVGGKYDRSWHLAHFRNPRDLVPGSVMPPFAWIANDPVEFEALLAYLQTLGRSRDWRPNHDYEK